MYIINFVLNVILMNGILEGYFDFDGNGGGEKVGICSGWKYGL
jgi:hypothetical protein